MVIGLGLITLALVNLYIQSNRLVTVTYPSSKTETLVDPNLLTNIDLTEKSSTDLVQPKVVQKPEVGDTIGVMEIPALKRELQIYEGTEEAQLSLGVGHVVTSVLPGYNDNSVIAGHRGTAFRKLYKLVIGDFIIITTTQGSFTYEVNEIRIVEGDDETVIVSTPHALLTLVTCYPFDWIGAAPQRYIVTAKLVQSIFNDN